MMKTTEAIYREACAEACSAVDAFHAAHGEPLYCGFGTVVIRPARGSFVKFLKDNQLGSKHWRTGYSISSYDVMRGHDLCGTQSMSIKEEACEAFAKVLNAYGINAHAESRAD
jgi:hypothetical protein